ncbi:MAG: glycosyltransferase family 4 protein [Euryarchaeota archaeon]|nr:glycosyltransferase family 4 protein [Euryarchaeota archaeon]MBV1728699.1 glycosyltransferase family 4 protein [Methanobacterium sp.]MBU4547873.1 glycosyltransferase family 4 protein [Euryarchaeota archaeon]MBU4608486.1 glycosyltransferase family 4 protein [Euryarchaeota archaeon]MBV1754554.1 glycosyltransferase family 4 protein [Methanobacterium sp.]
MKICFVTEYFPKTESLEVKGGAEATAFNEALQLSKNHELIVLTSLADGMSSEYEIKGIKVKGCGRKRSYVQSGSFKNRLSFMYAAYQEGIRMKVDLVVGYNFITHPVAWKIGKKLNIPSVARYHDVWIGEWVKNVGIAGITGEILERYTLSRKFGLIVAVSLFTRKKLESRSKSQKIAVVPNIVEFPPFKAEKYPVPTISCVSRLVEYKRVEDLIYALNILNADYPSLRCNIVGTGPQESHLRKLVEKLDLQKKVKFCGFVKNHTDVLRIIKSSHIFCLPSKVEGFGLVIVEAMGCGVPFVASNIEPVMEASAQKGGLFFNVQDPQDLADKIKFLLENEDTYNHLKEEGQKQYEKYKGERVGKKLEYLYTRLYEEHNKNRDDLKIEL